MSDSISHYLSELAAEGLASGIDVSRLVEESADHLWDAQRRYVAQGVAPDEAASRAVAAFGEPKSIVSDIARSKGGAMKLRYAAGVLGAASVATLLVGHITPPFDVVPGSTEELVLLSAFGGIVLAGALAAATASLVAGLVSGLVGAAALWALATSAAKRLGVEVISGGHIAALIAVALVTAVIVHFTSRRGSVGAALTAAGITNLLLNSGFEGVGGLGDGQGNLGVVLIAAGWLVILATVITPGVANKLRALLARILINVSRKVEPISA